MLHERSWPVAGARTVLVYVHGIASHGGWFAETADHLTASGVAVVAPDRRGSGLSSGPRGHLPSFERALADLETTVWRARDQYPAVPVTLAASSWAAKLALVYVVSKRAPVDALALLGPGLFPTVRLPLPRRLQVAGHSVAPRAPIPIPLQPKHYTANPPYRDFIADDPLWLRTATAQFFWETDRLDHLRRAASGRLELPVLLLQGDDDAMMDTARTVAWFNALPAPDKTYRSYPRGGHTLDFDANPHPYRDDLRSWLCRR